MKPPNCCQAFRRIEVPASLGVLAFYSAIFVVPFFYAIFLSFQNWDFVGDRVPVGLGNFERLVHDKLFWNGLWVSLRFALLFLSAGVAAQLVLAVCLHCLRSWSRLQRIMLALYFIPALTPWVASIIVWRWIFWPTGGLLNAVLTTFGIASQPLVSGSTQALYCVILMMMWRYLGYGAVIFLAGLNDIPESLYDAARIDGAGFLHQFFMITLPLLKPILLLQLVTGLIGLLHEFEPFYLLTKGGPGHSTRVLSLYIYNTAFDTYNFGYASALSLILFLVLLFLTVSQLVLFRPKWEY